MVSKNWTITILLTLCMVPVLACGFLDPASFTPQATCRPFPDHGSPITSPGDVYHDPTLTPVVSGSAVSVTTTTIYCTPDVLPPVTPATTETPENGEFQRGSIENLTLNLGDSQTLDTAINSNGSVIVWTEESNFLVLIDRKTYTDFSELGWASDGAVAMSPKGRAHVVYRDGTFFQLHYRASDSGEFIEDKPIEIIGSGSDPELIIDEEGWAHVFYVNGPDVSHRFQGETSWSNPAHFFRNQEAIEAILQDDGSLLAAATQDNVITLFRFQSGSWGQVGILHHPHMIGEPRLDSDGVHSYISFVTEEISDTAAPAHGFNTIQAAYSPDSGGSWSALFEVGRNEVAGTPSGRIIPPVYPAIAHHADGNPRVTFLYVFEEGDPPEEVPDALRFGRLHVVRCGLASTSCIDDPPGHMPHDLLSFFPTENLVADVNPEHASAIIGWTGLQVGEQAREVYSTFFSPQKIAGDN